MTHFICRPEPVLGESTFGFLLRFANDNGYAGLHPFKWPMRAIAGTPDIRFITLADIEAVTGHPVGLLRARLLMDYDPLSGRYGFPFRILERHVYADAYNFYAPRVCPECLREAAILRLEWEPALMIACEQHRLILRDQCPDCGEYLSWRRLFFAHCNCGSSMAEWQAKAARRDELEFQWLVFAHHRREVAPPASRWMRRFPNELRWASIEKLSRSVARMAHRAALSRDPGKEIKKTALYTVRSEDMVSCIGGLMALIREQPAFAARMLHIAPPKTSGRRTPPSPEPQSSYAQNMSQKANDVFQFASAKNDLGGDGQ